MECHQPSGSFKIRGIGKRCTELAEQGAKGFLSSSGGNAGLAVAYSGSVLDLPTTIVVPQTTSAYVCNRMRSLGAKVLRYGSVWDESDTYAREYAAKNKLSYIHPFAHPSLWSGHATLVQELTEQCHKPDAIVCAVGGGGLLCGIMEGLYQHQWGDVQVIAVETKGAASLQASVEAGRLVSIPEITSIAKTLGAKKVSPKALEWAQRHPIHCVQVSDEEAIQACVDVADDFRVLVEPACGAAYAVRKTEHPIFEQARDIVVVICGGSGVNSHMLAEWERARRSS